MRNITKICFCALLIFCFFVPRPARAAEPVTDIKDATVFTIDEQITDAAGLALASKVKSHVLVRGWFRWENAGNYDSYKWVIPEAHKQGTLFGGGVTVSAIYKGENGLSEAQFRDLATRDPEGNLYPAFGTQDYFHGALENKAYIDYVLSFVYRQIDAGIDSIFMDEVHGAYSPMEGYDEYGLAAFRDYLIKKYVAGKGWSPDDPRWTEKFKIPLDDKNICPDGTIRSFRYNEYLRRFGLLKSPVSKDNPLADEWGTPVSIPPADPTQDYTSARNDRIWKLISDSIREYARGKGRRVIITANGNNRYVDYQTNGIWKEWILKDGRLDARQSMITKWKYTVDTGRELAGDVPDMFFHDWGSEVPFKVLSVPDRIMWMRIYGAEHYCPVKYPINQAVFLNRCSC